MRRACLLFALAVFLLVVAAPGADSAEARVLIPDLPIPARITFPGGQEVVALVKVPEGAMPFLHWQRQYIRLRVEQALRQAIEDVHPGEPVPPPPPAP